MVYLIFIVLGIIQGLSEFLPISSSGHLVMMMRIFGIDENMMPTTVLLHVGTLLAVLVYYRRDIWEMLRLKNIPYVLKLIVATIPAVITALVFRDSLDSVFSGKYLSLAFMVTAIMLLILQFRKSKDIYSTPTYLDSVVMGVMQSVAIIPGVSRSGSTIFGGRMCGLDAEGSTKFAFLMSIPAILGSLVFDAGEILSISPATIPATLLGLVTAFIFGLLAINIMTKLTRRGHYLPFVVYLVVIAIVNLFI